jgi:hypothetical protein
MLCILIAILNGLPPHVPLCICLSTSSVSSLSLLQILLSTKSGSLVHRSMELKHCGKKAGSISLAHLKWLKPYSLGHISGGRRYL